MLVEIAKTIGEYCLTEEEGQRLYAIINEALNHNEPVQLDFAGVRAYASPYFNYAIGQLLRTHSRASVEKEVVFMHLDAVGSNTVTKVLDNAEQYYTKHQSEAIDRVVKKEI